MILYHICMWRFGDCIEIISDNKANGIKELKKEYCRLYEIYNFEKPTQKEIRTMVSELEITEFTLNKILQR